MVERERAFVGGTGKRGGHRAKAVAVLILGVVPATPGGDRRQGVVAEVPVQLGGQALVGVFHVAAGIGVDVAVVAGGPHRAQRVGERRGQGLADHAVRRVVVGLHVVGDQGQFQVVVGGEFQLAANALVVVAVDLLAIVLVVDITVVAAEQRTDRTLEHIRHQAAADAETGAAFVAAVVRLVDIAMSLGSGRLAGDIQHAGRGVLAEQRALGPAQYLDAFQVEQVEGGLARAGIDHAVDHRGHCRLDAGGGGNGAHAAHEQRGVLVRGAGTEVQRRHLLRDTRHAVAVIALQLFAVEDRDGHRDFLQRFFAAGGGDGHGFECRLLRIGRKGTGGGQGGQPGQYQKSAALEVVHAVPARKECPEPLRFLRPSAPVKCLWHSLERVADNALC